MKFKLVDRMISVGFMNAKEANNPVIIVCRMLAIPVVIFCVRVRLHPNIITGISIVFGCSGAFFYFLDAKLAFVVAWSLSVVLDYADGIIARKLGKESHFGYLFDMLGDRLKLVSLIVAWSLVEGSLLGTVLAVLAISILFATETISHLFVRHASDKPPVTASWGKVPYQVFLHFHMHSFLIYGLLLYLGETAALIANIWLSLIMFLDLAREFQARMCRDGRITVQINENILSKFALYRSKSSQK